MRMIRASDDRVRPSWRLPAISSAQAGRQFKNSWFWGIKGGGLYPRRQRTSTIAKRRSSGIDWLITRTHGGLYVSGGQSFFNQQTVHAARSAPRRSTADFASSISRTCASSTSR